MVASPILPGEATADLCDRLGHQVRICHLPWRSYGGLRAVSAPIVCVQAFEDAGAVRALLETRGRGRILVVDAGGLLRAAVLGERMARLGLANGWRGVIVHGAVRDVSALAALDFAVLALGAVPRRAPAQAHGETRHGALALGGVEIADGDWVALDMDGVVFVRPA